MATLAITTNGKYLDVVYSSGEEYALVRTQSRVELENDGDVVLYDNDRKIVLDYTQVTTPVSANPDELKDNLLVLLNEAGGASSEVEIITDGSTVDVHNPLPTDGDIVYIKDVDFTNSDFTDWTGDPNDLFESPFSASITNSTGDNPKVIILAFQRTIKANQIGLGENNGGDFSNTKIS
jgi:hypothetical protein